MPPERYEAMASWVYVCRAAISLLNTEEVVVVEVFDHRVGCPTFIICFESRPGAVRSMTVLSIALMFIRFSTVHSIRHLDIVVLLVPAIVSCLVNNMA